MQTGYRVNEKTKIGREIKRQIDNGPFKDAFEKADIAFLTHPSEPHALMNIHIYPENRLEHLKVQRENYPGWFSENDIHIPGCITNFMIDNVADISHILDKDEILIEVTFGRIAASSRRFMEYTEYPVNSHAQTEEIKYLLKNLEDRPFMLKHVFDPGNDLTKIKINGIEFEYDTVKVSALTAIETAIFMLHEKMQEKEK